MSSFSRSIQEFLDEKNAKGNILKDEEFKVSREALKCKRRELRKQGKENKPNATIALTNEDVERIFWRKPVWRPWASSTCAYDVVFTNSLIRRTRSKTLIWTNYWFGDIALKKDECGGAKHPESCPFWGFQLKPSSCHFGSETPPPHYRVFWRRRWEQNFSS